MRHLTILPLAALLATPALGAGPAAPPEAAMLAPHRAVYDLELGSARDSSNVAGVRGRLVFEFTGSVCEGFTQNMRFVMGVANRDGGETMSDLRSTTFETVDGGKFRFKIDDFQNSERTDETIGNVELDGTSGKLALSISKPAAQKLSLDQGTIFPVQHTIRLLSAARRGEHAMAANLFDGSEKGQKVSFTNTVIGAVRAAAASPDLTSVRNAERLSALKSWPVTIAYFDTESTKAEGLPAHEMSFVLYENGVVRQVDIDYGNLSVKGTLAEIEFYPPPNCP